MDDIPFFVGCWGAHNVQPRGSRAIWQPPTPLWTVGRWAPTEVTTAACAAARVTVFGCCLARLHELQYALRTAARRASPEVLAHLPGSFAAVLDDGTAVHIVTDLAGVHPVFYRYDGSTCWYSSNAAPLVALGRDIDVETLNPEVLAAQLFCPQIPEARFHESVFAGVGRVDGGEVLTIGPRGVAIGSITPPTAMPLWQAAPVLAEGLDLAVRRRVERADRPTVDLSGGLDSSTLALLATHADARTMAITYRDPHASNADDVRAATRVAVVEPRLTHVVVDGDALCLPFSDTEVGAPSDEPNLDVLIAARTRRRLAPAIEAGSDMHLGGDGGDAVLGGDLTYLGDLAGAGRLRSLWCEATGWARLRHHRTTDLIRDALRLGRTGWSGALHECARQLEAPSTMIAATRQASVGLAWAQLSAAAGWSHDEARKAVGARLRAVASTTTPTCKGADGVNRRAVLWHGAATRGYLHLARTWGLRVHVPFLDNQVVRACWSVPVVERTSVTSAKPLLRAALSDRFPPGVLDRSTKGDYTAAEYHGLRRNARRLRSLLRRPLLAEIGVIDPADARSALESGIAGHSVRLDALGTVLATEIWLRSLQHDRRTWWCAADNVARPRKEAS